MATYPVWHFRKAFAPLLGSVALATSGATLAENPQSTAAGLRAELAYRGQSVHLAAGHLSGRTGGAYDSTVTVGNFQENKSGTPVVLAARVSATATAVTAHVASSGVSLDEVSSQGDVSIANIQLEMLINPPPVSGETGTAAPQPPVPMLTVAAQQMSSAAFYTRVFPNGITANGTASIGSLKLTGSLFGGQTVKYSGTPAPNTVIFDSPALTVTLNKQIEPTLSLCPNCTPQPVSIGVVAVDILLKHVVEYGRAATGEVRLGTSFAR